jgi:SAM-dependent MidA family methyltransferase
MDIKPSKEALAHSRQLSNLIDLMVENNDGGIPFSKFMDLALYSPGLGYYSAGAHKLGAAGDFTTGPELSPWFGATIAKSIGPALKALADIYQTRHILEFGAGSGALAKSILTQLQLDQSTPDIYYILEVSPDLKERQMELLLPFLKESGSHTKIIWLDALPRDFTGVMLANEVIDAFPVELVVKRRDGWHLLMVTKNLGASISDDSPKWLLSDGALLDINQLPSALKEVSDQLPLNYQTEIHPQALAWIKSLANSLKEGIFLTLDYGFPAREYYHPQRATGTLMAHYRHQASPDPFFLPGLCDLTAHVEWSTLAQTAQESGLECIGYQSQASFLLNAGIANLLLENLDPRDATTYLPHSNAVQKLLSEAEMGELFKAIAFKKVSDANSILSETFDELSGFKGRFRPL